MWEFFKGWRRKVGVVTLVMALVFMVVWIRSGVTHDSHVRNPNQSLPSDPKTEIIQASHEVSDEAAKVPKVSVHVWMIEVMASSPDSSDILQNFGARLDSALVEFNSPSAPQPRNFATSDTLAALIREFRSKAKIIIHDESPRIISSGQTDNWGDAITISATPTVKSEDKVFVSTSAAFGGSGSGSSIRSQSTMIVQSGQTLNFGGGANCSTQTTAFQVPILGQSPIIGQWFTFPVTRTTGNSKQFVLSATILPGSEVRSESE